MFLRAFLVSLVIAMSGPATAGGVFTSPAEPEFGREMLTLVRATEALFDALEAEGANPDTPGLELRPARRTAEPASLEIAQAGRSALSAENGPVANLTAYRVTWYPTDRLSGSVDFVGTWGKGRNLVCGYVTWDMSDPTAPVLAAMTTSYLDTGTLVRLPADAAHAELLRANCAYGEIEPNLELVRPAG